MIKEYLESGFDFKKSEFDIKLKYHFFNLLILSNIVAVTVAGFFRLYHGEYRQMAVDFGYVLISVFLAYLVRLKKEYFHFAVYAAILVAYVTVAMTFYIEASSFTGLGWYFILILVTFFLTEKKFSTFIFILSMFSILSTVYLKYGDLSLQNLPFGLIPFIIFSLFINLYNKRNLLQQELLREQNKLLEAYSFSLENYDAITKLPNRIFFKEKLEKKIESSKKNKQVFSLIKIDLDDFKKINDTYGHSFGDDLLVEIAQRLIQLFGTDRNLSKMGVDEFIIINNSVEATKLIQLTSKIQNSIKEEIVIHEKSVYITSSIGIALYDKDGKDTESLIKNADSALHQAKQQSRNNISFYHSSFGDTLNDELTLLYDLKNAIEKEEFEVYYQPQIDALSGKISGVEALVRWNSSKYKKMVPPDRFIPFAEEYGLIHEIDMFVMKSAMQHFYEWKSKYPDIGRVAINLSIKVLDNQKYVENLKKLIQELNFNPKWLELEIVEGHIMQDAEVFIKILEEISDMGVEIAIDDFGTGYSSLAYIQRLRIHKLKIDKSFLVNVPHNIDGSNLVKTIIQMSCILNLDILAEGVEEENQKEFLVEHGCSKLQGYLYSKPIPADLMYDFIEKNQQLI